MNEWYGTILYYNINILSFVIVDLQWNVINKLNMVMIAQLDHDYSRAYQNSPISNKKSAQKPQIFRKTPIQYTVRDIGLLLQYIRFAWEVAKRAKGNHWDRSTTFLLSHFHSYPVSSRFGNHSKLFSLIRKMFRLVRKKMLMISCSRG